MLEKITLSIYLFFFFLFACVMNCCVIHLPSKASSLKDKFSSLLNLLNLIQISKLSWLTRVAETALA